MAPKLTEYERKRLENIKRNQEMMDKLKLQSKAIDLSTAAKRDRDEKKALKPPKEKKPKSEIPIIPRRSLRPRTELKPQPETPIAATRPVRRTRRVLRDRGGVKPDYSSQMGSEDDDTNDSPCYDETGEFEDENPNSCRKKGPISMQEAYIGDSSDQSLIDTIMNMSGEGLVPNVESFDPKSMVLKQENTARVMSEKILNLKFFPCPNRNMIVAGSQYGEIAVWDIDCEDGDSDGIYLYQPHSDSISGISIQPFALSKVFSSCCDGYICMMDVGREVFDLVYSTDNTISSLSQRPHDAESIYFGEGGGLLNVFDARVGKTASSWMLHEERINTIDFNPENTNLMATSSTDGTACIWDLRNINAHEPKYLKMDDYTKPVHSAYFSPSGRFLASTSVDDKIGILSGVDFTSTSTIYHLNSNGRGVSDFRAIWGWNDSYLFIGNLKKGVDVISTSDKSMVTLQSSYMSSIAYRFAAHPYKVGTLAGGTRQIFVWT